MGYIYTGTGAHIKGTLFAVQYRSEGPKNISCVTPFGVIIDLKESAKILFNISNNNHWIILNFISEK